MHKKIVAYLEHVVREQRHLEKPKIKKNKIKFLFKTCSKNVIIEIAIFLLRLEHLVLISGLLLTSGLLVTALPAKSNKTRRKRKPAADWSR
jgi:hypothetical protein